MSFDILSKKREIAAMEKWLAAKAKIDLLKAEIKNLNAVAEPIEAKLRETYPQGCALDMGEGNAVIVEFNTTPREVINSKEVRRLLGDKLPMRKTNVKTVNIYQGTIE